MKHTLMPELESSCDSRTPRGAKSKMPNRNPTLASAFLSEVELAREMVEELVGEAIADRGFVIPRPTPAYSVARNACALSGMMRAPVFACTKRANAIGIMLTRQKLCRIIARAGHAQLDKAPADEHDAPEDTVCARHVCSRR